MRRLWIALVAMASAAAVAPALLADSITTNIEFNCTNGSGTGSAGALCNGSSPKSTAPVSSVSWTEGGYTVSSTSLPTNGTTWFNSNRGDPKPGLSFGNAAGNYDLNVTSDKINDFKIVLDLGDGSTYADCNHFNLSPAPEPNTLVSMGTGILALAFLARRRANKRHAGSTDLIA